MGEQKHKFERKMEEMTLPTNSCTREHFGGARMVATMEQLREDMNIYT